MQSFSGRIRVTSWAWTMLFGKPVNRSPNRVLTGVASYFFQNGNPDSEATMHALVLAGSTGSTKLSGKPLVKVMLGGPVRVEMTTTLKLQGAIPQALVAVQVTKLVPIGKAVPEGGV